jgi:predicted DNA-binding transcriptional regulator AlpA
MSQNQIGLTKDEGSDDSVVLLDLKAVCAFFGGTKPIHPATLYRGIRAGMYPAPANIGQNMSRWVQSECKAARDVLISRPRPLSPMTLSSRSRPEGAA